MINLTQKIGPSAEILEKMQSILLPLAMTDPSFFDVKLMKEVNQSVEKIYEVCGANSNDGFVFTSCEAEAIMHVFYSVLTDEILKSGKNHVLIGNLEGSSALLGLERLEEFGCNTELIPVNSEGIITKQSLNLFVSPKTSLFSISLATPLVGVIQPIYDLAEYCHEKGILFHVSVTGALGQIYFRLSDLPIDFLTFEGGAIGGPLTSGALFIAARHKKISPLFPSASRLNPLRGGVFDPAPLIGLGMAAKCLIEEREPFELADLTRYFEKEVKRHLKDIEILLEEKEKLMGISIISFSHIHAELLLFHLYAAGIRASMGGDHVQKLEHILVKCGYDLYVARSSLVFTFSKEMTMQMLDKAIEIIVVVVNRLLILSKGLSFDEGGEV